VCCSGAWREKDTARHGMPPLLCALTMTVLAERSNFQKAARPELKTATSSVSGLPLCTPPVR